MRGVTFAYLGPEAEASKFAKKGTTTDVTLFNAKKGDTHLNLVHATRYPEKLPSLLVALDLADEIILHPAVADRTLGETVVGAELFGKTHGFLRPGPQAPLEQLKGLLAKTALSALDATEEPDAVLRDRLYERASESSEGPTVIAVDHSFPVKGVGTVVLGLVRSGSVSTHQTLQIFPTEKTLEVRSIQVHDVDYKTAPTRSRVGLAVKGVEAEDVGRGTVLAPPETLKVLEPGKPVPLRLRPSPFAKWQPRAGAALHMFHMLQDIVVRIESVGDASGGEVILNGILEAPLVAVPGQPVVLVDLDNKAQRLIGRVTLPA